MSLEQLESSIMALTPEERKQFAQWFEEHLERLVPLDNEELTPEQQAELLGRREQALAHPELLEPWEGSLEFGPSFCLVVHFTLIKTAAARG